ncbi:uncharacterized protein BX663DRAFT_546617 [Cokeromyces recurvatus]|nr:uncharacterized protein BX663DRAFT_546617 [Cokeromyces recurvatus]KAI7898273.1 hypothetical protein BX663DRAFT_546617 [Cokeromyces recurvatus]
MAAKIVYNMNFTALIGYTDMKPDIKYRARIGTADFDFLIFEVKQPRSIAEDGLFKVSIELQLMLNRMVKKKYTTACCLRSCYKRMELVAPLVYLFTKIQTLYIPRSVYDFHVLLGAIPALLQLEQLVVNEVSKARRDINSDENDKLGCVRSPLTLLRKF